MCQLAKLPKEERYGAIIERELTDQFNETIDLAQVYVALQRLVDKKLIDGKETQAPTGNHQVVVYTLKPLGREALRHAAAFYKMLAEAAPAN
ncbi:MAG: PadR family transcriptional regulator [Hyphomicrobiaceae bacterium]